MDKNTIMKITYLISRDNYILKGVEQIKEDLIDNLETLYMYSDITEEELNSLIGMIPNSFDYVMNYVCDLMELDYEYLNNEKLEYQTIKN